MTTWLALASLLAVAPSHAPAKKVPRVAPAASTAEGKTAAEKSVIHVEANRLQLEERHRRMVYTGNVRATRGATKLKCDRLVAFYSSSRDVTRVECTGNVEILDGDRWAKGDRGEFDNLSGVMELTGDPEVKQGASHLKGSKITFYVGTNTLDVENVTTLTEQPGGLGKPSTGAKKSTGTGKHP